MNRENILIIETIKNFPVVTDAFNTDDGVKEAEQLFLQLIRENTDMKLEDEDEINGLLDDAYFESDDWSVSMIWAKVV
jgi:hypothetical protein